jgi:hypothetical protein
MTGRVIYSGDRGLVPFTAVGEVIFASADYAQVYWDDEYILIVPVNDLAIA